MSESAKITPPAIVARADNPPAALAAFIAQELEHWGFCVELFDDSPVVVRVGADNCALLVRVDD